MAEEFDLISAFISVSIRKQSLEQVESQIKGIAERLKSLKASVGLRLVGRQDFRKELKAFLDKLPKGKVKVTPVIDGKKEFKDAFRKLKKDAGDKPIKATVKIETGGAEKAINNLVGKAKVIATAARRAGEDIDKLNREIERWGRIRGRAAEAETLLGITGKPNFGSMKQIEEVKARMRYYDSLRSQAERISELTADIQDWGTGQGRAEKAQELISRVGAKGFGSSGDFRAILREMRAVDKAIASTERKAEAISFANSWGKATGNIEAAKKAIAEIESKDFFSQRDLAAVRAVAREYDKISSDAEKIAQLNARISEFGEKPGRQKVAQELMTRVNAPGFAVATQSNAVLRDMRAADRQIASMFRKNEAAAYLNNWQRLSGKVKETQQLLEMVNQTKLFTKEDFAAIRQMTKEIDQVSAAAARAQAALNKASNQLKIISKPDPRAMFKFRSDFVPMQDILANTMDLDAKRAQQQADAEKQRQDNLKRAAARAAAEGRRTANEFRAQRARRATALRGALFEAGFVAGPAAGILGNLVGVKNQTSAFIQNSQLAQRAASKFRVSIGALGATAGVAASVVTAAVGGIVAVFGQAFSVISQFNQQAIAGLKGALSAVIGPALALFQAIRGIATYLPLVAAGIAGFVGETLTKATVEFDKIQSLFNFTFADQAASQLNLVRQVSDAFGLSLDALAVGYGKLAAAAKDSGVTQEEIRQLFIGTSSAAAVFKLNQGDLDGVFRAYQQIISKSVVSSEELRQQLSERLPAAFSLAAKSLGKSQQDLNEALANGSVTAEEFIPAFGRALRQAYDQNASGIVDTLPAKLNRLQNSLLDLQRSAEGTDFLESFVDLKQGLIDPFIKDGAIKNALKNVFVEAGNAFRFFTAQIPLAIELLKNVWRAVRPLVEAFATLQLVFSALAIAAAKEFLDVRRNAEIGLGDAILKVKEFSDNIKSALNLDLSDFKSIMGFVKVIIVNSELALAAFLEALNGAIRVIITFASTLYSQIIPLMFELGVQMGKAIGNGLMMALTGGDNRLRDATNRLADVGTLLRDREVTEVLSPFLPPSRRKLTQDEISKLNVERLALTSEVLRLEKAGKPGGLGGLFAEAISFAGSKAFDELSGINLEPFEKIGALSKKAQENLAEVQKEPKRDLSFLEIALTELRKSLGTGAATTSDFESQFFGFEEFQRFLQSGEQVRVAENTQKIYEISQQQLDVLNKMNTNQASLNSLLNLEGAYMRAPSTLRWEN